MLQKLQSIHSNLVVLDAGDLLFGVPNPPPADRETAERKMQLLIQAYNDCKYDALNIGINDLPLGIDFLKQFESMANFPFLSANILDSSGNVIFNPYIIVRKDNISVGVVGVTSGNTLTEGVRFAEVVESAQAMSRKIETEVDYTILLASVYNPEAKQLQSADLEYDLIIRSHTPRFSRILNETQSGYYLQTGKEGQYLQLLDIRAASSVAKLTDLSNEKQRLRFIASRLDTFKEHAGNQSPEEVYKDRKAIVSFIDGLEQQQQELKQIIAQNQNYIALDMINLGSSVPDNEKWLSRVKEFNDYHQTVVQQ